MNINRVVLTGNLTADPELRQLSSGNSLCRLRLASNTRRRQPDGTWREKPNYFDVVVWGAQGESASRFLRKGSSVAVDGRLEWREWETTAGEKRQAVEVIADQVQFLEKRSAAQTELPTEQPADIQPDDAEDVPF